MQLKTRLCLSFFILIVCLMGILFEIISRDLNEMLTAEMVNKIQSVAEHAAIGINRELRYEKDRHQLVTSRTWLRKLVREYVTHHNPRDKTAILKILQDALRDAGDGRQFVIYDRNRSVVAATHTDYDQPMEFDAGFWEEASHSPVSRVLPAVRGGRPLMTAGPLIWQGEFIGFLLSFSAVDPILKIVQNYSNLGETGDAFLVMRGGSEKILLITPRRFADADTVGTPVADLSEHGFISDLMRDKTQIVDKKGKDYRGVDVISIGNYISQNDWGLIVRMDRSEAFAPRDTIYQHLFFIFLFGGGFSLIGVWLVGSHLATPISKLSAICARYVAGDSDVRIPMPAQKGSDELSILARTLHLLFEQIEKETGDLTNRQEALLNMMEDAELSRKEAERKRDAAAHLAVIVNSSRDAIMRKTLDGIVTSWNPGAERLYGYREQEIVGRSVKILIPEQLQNEVPDFLARLKKGEAIEGYETVRKRKDGSLVDVSLSLSPILDDRGRAVAASIIARDMTERKKAEERLSLVVEAAPSAMIMVDRSGTISLLNRQAETLFGYSRQELIGRKVEMLVPSRFRERHPEHRDSFFTAPKARYMGGGRDLFGLKKNGIEVPIEIGLNPIETPEGLYTLAAIIDITERKKAENVIYNKNRELETMLYIVSHDLGEPLRSIQNFSSMVLNRYADKLDDKGKDFLSRINRAGNRMRILLDEILQLSRVQRMEETFERVPGAKLVAAALVPLREAIKREDAKIKIADEFPDYNVSRLWVVQALTNLISNALKFHQEGRGPEIEIVPFVPEADNTIKGFAVKDRGPGVAAEHAERIFSLFQRAVPREVEGTGAGLAIVAEVARKHGGKAWVEPRSGGGAVFILTFDTQNIPMPGYGI